MKKLLKTTIALFTVLISTNSLLAQFPQRPPLPAGMKYDTIRQRSSDDWEFIQVRMPKEMSVNNPNGQQIVAEGNMHHGVIEGVWINYWETGSIEDATSYYNGKKNGMRVEFDPSGSLTTTSNYKDDLLDGPSRTYPPHISNPADETYYSQGVKHGIHIKWYPNRNIQEKATYVNGKLDGLATWYYDNGEKSVEYTYHMGVLDGPAAVYFNTGKVSDMGEYKDNKQSGIWKEFYENGILKGEGEYDDAGEKTGMWKEYSIDGRPLGTKNYSKEKGKEKKSKK
jgi:antitoxin component YwqK of YwqJK toxin-antitoxin module